MKWSAILFVVVILFMLAFAGSAYAADSQPKVSDPNINSNSEGSPQLLATTNVYVNVNTGNDSWDGSNPVHTNGTTIGPKQHISKGITSSFNGGNLYIANGTYKEWGLTIDRTLNIYGSGINSTIVDAQGNGIAFKINANINVTIQHLSMTGGWGQGTVSNEDGDNGGGVYNLGTLTLTDCNIYNNHAGNGQDGTAGHGAGKGGNGGGIWNSGTLTIINCDIHNNFSGNGGDASGTRHGDHGGFGAGIYNSGTLTIQDSWIHDNTAGNGGNHSGLYSGSYGGYGGGICNTNRLTIINSEIYNNKAGNGANNVVEANAQPGGYGGGIYNTGTANLQNVNMHDNIAGTGGTVVNVDGHGGEGGYGGAIANPGSLTITGTNTKITNNAAGTGGTSNVEWETAGLGGKGGGIYNTGTCHITDATISYNKGGAGGTPYTLESNGGDGGNGGAIDNEATGTLTLDNCTINNNQAGDGHSGVTNENKEDYGGGDGGKGGNGGAINNAGTLTITGCDISSNRAGNGGNGGQSTYGYDAFDGGIGGDGGAIYNSGTLTLTGSTVNLNSAGKGGNGGLGRLMDQNTPNGDSLFVRDPGNGANGGNGGAIYNSGHIISITNTHLDNNNAGTGGNGGLYKSYSSLAIYGATPGTSGNGGSGGGICSTGTLDKLQNTTINSNKAGAGGNGSPVGTSPAENGGNGGNAGGLWLINPITIINCEISGNQAGNGGNGGNTNTDQPSTKPGNGGVGGSAGGIYIGHNSNIAQQILISITNTTINNNSAGNGGAGGIDDANNSHASNGGPGGNAGGIEIISANTYNVRLNMEKSNLSNNKAGLGGQPYLNGVRGANGIGGGLYSSNNQNFSVSFCRILDNTPQAIYLNLTSADVLGIVFQNNWWGSNAEPTGQFMGTHIDSLNYEPWLILSIKANPALLYNTKTSNITANLIMNNIGQNTLSMYGKSVPDNIPVLFGTNFGTLNPINGFTLNGSANSLFTATISGNGKVCATVDHQTVCTDIQILPTADIVITKIIDKAKCHNGSTTVWPPTYGCSMYYYITVHNNGPDNATGIIIKDPLPSTLTYANYWVSIDNGITWKAAVDLPNTYNPLTGVWNVGDLNFGAPDKILSIRTIVNAADTWIDNTAFKTAQNEYDPTTPDTSSANVYIPPLTQADLTINPTVPSIAFLGQNFSVTIKVGNKGPDVAKDVIINIPIPEVFQFISATVDQGTWSYNESTRILTWNIGDVAVGDPYLYITLKPTALGTYQINRLLTSITYDPNLDNHITNLTITVKEPGKDNETPTNQTVNGQTIPMQKTGTPIAALLLGLLTIIGGSVYNRLR